MGVMMIVPTTNTFAAKGKNTEVAAKKIIDCTLEDEVVIATSGDGDGPIYKLVVVNPARQIVYTREFAGFQYYVEVNLAFLPAGNYNVKVYAGNLVYTEGIVLY